MFSVVCYHVGTNGLTPYYRASWGLSFADARDVASGMNSLHASDPTIVYLYTDAPGTEIFED